MTTNLKPCPFCGAPNPAILPRTCNKSTPYNPMDRAYPEVRCRGCGASAPGANWGEPQSAVDAWNARESHSASGESEDARDAARYRFIRDCDRFNSRGVMDGGRAGMMVGFWREDLDREVDRRIAATHEVHRVLPSEKTP